MLVRNFFFTIIIGDMIAYGYEITVVMIRRRVYEKKLSKIEKICVESF